MSSSTSNQTRAAALAYVQALIAGTNKHFPNGSFTLGNATFTTASLLQVLQSLAAAISAVIAAHANVKDALTALQDLQAKVDPTLGAYRRFILAAFSSATQSLADFGIAPPKVRAPRTAEQKAAAAAKAKATREARGTTSKKQKLAIKGDVIGVTVTPVTSTSATPAAQPAPTANAAPPSTGGTPSH
jgi:hypothetical protein